MTLFDPFSKHFLGQDLFSLYRICVEKTLFLDLTVVQEYQQNLVYFFMFFPPSLSAVIPGNRTTRVGNRVHPYLSVIYFCVKKYSSIHHII